MTGYDRDLIGYADEPPDPKWPDGAGFALSFVMNYEEGSEPSMQDGEGRTETGPTEAGERLFTFVRYPPEQWRSSRTRMLLSACTRSLNGGPKPSACYPVPRPPPRALESGQITTRRVDGWQTLERSPADLDLAA